MVQPMTPTAEVDLAICDAGFDMAVATDNAGDWSQLQVRAAPRLITALATPDAVVTNQAGSNRVIELTPFV